MAIKRFQADAVWNTGIDGRTDNGIRVLKYSGGLGGGTLSLHSLSQELSPVNSQAIETPVANGTLTAAMNDTAGNAIKQKIFQTTGPIVVKLTGATAPDCVVSVE